MADFLQFLDKDGRVISQGSGDAPVKLKPTSSNTGRKARSQTVTFAGAGVSRKVTINQSAKDEFVSISDLSSDGIRTLESGLTSLTISGWSNSTGLLFYLDNPAGQWNQSVDCFAWFLNGSNRVAVYNSETAAGIDFESDASGNIVWSCGELTGNQISGQALPSDPGKDKEYRWSITIKLTKANTAEVPMCFGFKVTNLEGTKSQTCIVKQTNASKFMYIYEDANHTSDAEGKSYTANSTNDIVTIYVDSNSSWTIS